MVKNTFMIRASVNAGNAGGFNETEIDLGSYTNLGSSKPEVLRIHNVHTILSTSGGQIPKMEADKAGNAAWQLTTQSQTGLVLMNDDSFVSGGTMAARNPDQQEEPPTQVFGETLLAQDFEAGSVIAVPSLFLGGLAGTEFTEDVYYSVILECTTEAMSKANAVALAISQQ
tara:strand:+ start:133 stop:645 length:513 start_codon:yes stop_codon:yes gene_type:complete